MTWTTPQNIKDRWLGNDDLPADSKLTTLIGDVERQLTDPNLEIQARIDNSTLDIAYVQQVVSTVVIEYLHTQGRPLQMLSQSITGAGAQTEQYIPGRARYSLKLTAEDIALLAPKKSSGIIMLDIAPEMRSQESIDGRTWHVPFQGGNL